MLNTSPVSFPRSDLIIEIFNTELLVLQIVQPKLCLQRGPNLGYCFTISRHKKRRYLI